MNPYHKLVNDYARLARAGKSYPLGNCAKSSTATPAPDAPTVAIFSPHPDDETITGGLALRLLRQARWRIVDVAVTLGSNQARRAGRLAELKACCDYIDFELLPAIPDGLDKINVESRQANPELWAQSSAVIVQKLNELKPKVIFFPHDSDWNTTHIGTHFLVLDALQSMPASFSCYIVETEFWMPMSSPNLMVELSEEDLGDLVTAISFHVEEVRRNPYHLSLPAWTRQRQARQRAGQPSRRGCS